MSGRHLTIVPPSPVFNVPECKSSRLPCIERSCRHHMSVGERATLPAGYDTCSLAAVDRHGEHTLDEVGRTLNLVRERVRTIQDDALTKLRRKHPEIADYLEGFTEAETFDFPDSVEISQYRHSSAHSEVRLISDETGTDSMFDVDVIAEAGA